MNFKKVILCWDSCLKSKLFGFLVLLLLMLINLDVLAQVTIYVSKSGSDSNNGLSSGSAVKTIQKGIDILKQQNADILSVGSGVYYESPTFSNMGSSSSKPIWIKAEVRGQTTISGMWKAAAEGTVSWTNQGNNVWSTYKANDSFIGSYKDKFLFHHDTRSDLEASSILGVNKPAYGFAHDGSTMYLRVPSGENPNGEAVMLTDVFAKAIATVTNSPYLIFDGFAIEGGGNGGEEGAAVLVDSNSDHITFRNMIFRYCRRCVQLPDYGIVEWSEYYYPNLYNYVEDIRGLNGGDPQGIFTLVKDYFSNSGNAYYEGGLAVSYRYEATDNIEIRYCYLHETFDAEVLGQFNNSSSHHNVYNYNYDNHNELECWKGSTHKGINLKVHDNLMLNCMGGPMSHQDTGTNMLGPHYVYRNVIRITDYNHSHPAFVIKNKNGDPNLKVYYYHNLLHNIQGPNTGWGTVNWLYWNDQHQDALTFYNNIMTLDNCTNTYLAPYITSNDNLLVNSSDMSWLRGSGGVYVGSNESSVQWINSSNLNFGIQSSSPAVNAGRTLSYPDSHTPSGAPDIGPFEYGENPGTDWPREMSSGVFNTNPPPGFEGTSNQDPTCSITSPSNGANFTSGSNVTINANASDSDGSVTKVSFYQNSSYLGEDTSSPYSYTWNSPSDGSYTLTAVATDNDGATGTSSGIGVSVGDVTATIYDGADASVVNGTIDTDNAGYTGAGYANTDNASGNYVEWTNVSASSSGNVTLTIRFANGDTTNRTADVIVNSSTQTTISLAPTGNWTTWDTEDITVSLNSGTNTIRLTATAADGLANIDKITIEESGSGGSGGDITVRAKAVGNTGGEIQLQLDDVVKATWTLNSLTYQDFVYTASVSSANIKLAFIDQSGNADAQIDYLIADGTTYQTEDQATNQAVWQDASCGGSYSELMHCADGRYIDFGNVAIGNGPSEADIVVSAKAVNGTGVQLQLQLDDVVEETWTLTSTAYQDFTYTTTVSSANIKLAFVNPTGSNYDIQVDYIEVNGTTYQAEDQATNTAVWQDGSCGGSYSEMMQCADGRYIDFGTISTGLSKNNANSIIEDELLTITPSEYKLFQNSPNPFNPTTQIRYELPETSDINLTVYNFFGQKVATLVNNVEGAGQHIATWNGKNDHGQKVASGNYIVRLTAGNLIKTIKMVLLK